MNSSAADLFDRHHLAIYRYLLRMTGRREVAEDLTQEVFLRIVRGVEIEGGSDGERAWLFHAARNLLIDRQRRLARNPVNADMPAECGNDAGHDLALAVREALEQLPPDDREVFLLRVVGGLGHEEIASVCGVTAASVRSRIFRARSALRAVLGGWPSRTERAEASSAPTTGMKDVPRLKVVR